MKREFVSANQKYLLKKTQPYALKTKKLVVAGRSGRGIRCGYMHADVVL